MEIINANIESTSLGEKAFGCPTFWITLEWDGAGQGFGGYALGGQYTDYVIKGILEAVGVEKWEDLKGKNVRIKREGGKIIEIGHIIKDKWFSPKELA